MNDTALRCGIHGSKCGLWLLLAGLTLAGGCTHPTLHTPSVSDASASLAQSAAQKKVQALQQKRHADLPDTLGGIISSDRWVIYKEKEEEEFEGNVRYDNGTYSFRADYALSQRKKNLFSASGNVYARYNEVSGGYYEIYTAKATYNYQTAQGTAQSSSQTKTKLIYKAPEGDLVTALAQRAEFNIQQKTYRLTGDVFVTYQDEKGHITTLKAQELTVRQQEQYALLQGNAEAENANYLLKAQTIEYDGKQGYSYAYGARPLVQGKTEDGTFAIIADKITAENATRKIHMQGRVEGWTVSEQINRSAANKTFKR